MGALQLTYQPKFKIVHRTGELMRSHEAKSVQLWLRPDPLSEEFPDWSPYAMSFNNPIRYVDPDGMEPIDPLAIMRIRSNRASNLQGMVRNGGTRPHKGFDLAAKPGTPVLAVKNASVYNVIKDEKAAYGNQIVLKITGEDGKSTYAQYSHLSNIDVKKGQVVKEGDVIGATGVSGNANNLPLSESHLHFEMRDAPVLGKGLSGRLDPNLILDTKFYSQNPNLNQTNTGVIKVDIEGNKVKMNIDGSTQKMPNSNEVKQTKKE